MHAFDPEGTCIKATRHLQRCLVEEGNRLAEAGLYEQALVILFRAYSLLPGVTPVLHAISAVYEAQGDKESAMACRRAVIPEIAENRYFNAQHSPSRVIAARKASNCQHLKTHKPHKQGLRTPKSNGTPVKRPEFRAKETESRGSFVSDMKNASFWFDGFNTVITDNRQKILKEHIKGNVHLVADVARQQPEQTIDATVCFIDARSSSIYYHWMIDVMPKLALVTAAGIDLHQIDYFIVRCQSAFQQFTLNHLGITTDRILEPSSPGFTRCKRLIVPFLKHDRGDRFYNGLGLGMAPWVPAWLRSTFVQSCSPGKTKIYISRATRGTRSPVDEQALIRELEHRGIQSVSLETLNVVEQANLLSTADLVIAPHGAGLSNIAFCQPGTTVVEIFGNYVVPCYWALSELTGLDYHAYFVDEPASSDDSPNKTGSKLISMSDRRNQSIELAVDPFLAYIDKFAMPASTSEARSA